MGNDNEIINDIRLIESELGNNFGDVTDLTDTKQLFNSDIVIPCELESWNKSKYVDIDEMSNLLRNNGNKFG